MVSFSFEPKFDGTILKWKYLVFISIWLTIPLVPYPHPLNLNPFTTFLSFF